MGRVSLQGPRGRPVRDDLLALISMPLQMTPHHLLTDESVATVIEYALPGTFQGEAIGGLLALADTELAALLRTVHSTASTAIAGARC